MALEVRDNSKKQGWITEDDSSYGELQTLEASPFDYERIEFPTDLGAGTRHPHYLTFYINLQNLSKYTSENSRGQAPTGDQALSEIQRHQQGPNGSFLSTNIETIGNGQIGFGRKTTRTGTVIRLFMPETLAWSFSQGYKNASLSDLPGAAVASGLVGGGKSIVDAVSKGGGITNILTNLVGTNGEKAIGSILPFAEGALAGVTGDRDLATSAFGVTVNPQIDVIYSGPELRTFSFEFLFAPRTRKEADAVHRIIQLFKFHAAPELLEDKTGFGRYFVPPSEFDLEFSAKSLGKISTCVLEDLTVDYAPNGATFYYDNRPVFTRLTLRFRELEFITKELVKGGY